MNTRKRDIESNTNIDNSLHKELKIKSSKKRRSSTLTSTTKLNLADNAKISANIIDIDDSPDIATWNKNIIKNKDNFANKENRFRYTKIKPPIPPVTTNIFKKAKEDNNGIDYLIDPTNLNEIAKVYHNEEILTDQAIFSQKGKLKKPKF
ncbi:MAG TPA: hypothetical protein VFK40_10215 [Nitrososphaeraceae archaeon]|nr:hypothetical protein [Nitrososphaeraceae archaeon]